MSFEKEGTQLVLEEAQAQEAAHVLEGVESHLGRPALARQVEPFSRLTSSAGLTRSITMSSSSGST